MKYIDKWSNEVVEAVKWDGNIETIKNNKWLEDAIKDNKIILGIEDISNKKPILLLDDENKIMIKENHYIIKNETYNLDYKINVMNSKNFENMFEIIEENKKDCILTDLKINMENSMGELANTFLMEIKKKNEERKLVINNEKYINSFKVVTKDMFIKDNIGVLDIDSINHQWDKISKGNNFILFKKDINDMNRYYSVEEFNGMFKR